MVPYQKFQTIFKKWFETTSKSIGLNILNKDFKPDIHTGSFVLFVASMLVFCIYTICSTESEMQFKSASCLSLAIQGIVKTFCILINRSMILFLAEYLESIYFVNAKKSQREIYGILDECMTHLHYLTGALFALYVFCGIEFCVYPVMVFIFTRVVEPVLPVYIPFFDFNSTNGFTITTAYHCVLIFVASSGFAFSDGLFFNLVFNVFTMSKLQCNQLNILNGELNQPKPSILLIKTRLMNLFKMNQEMQKFIDIINRAYFWMIFTQILTTALSAALVIFIIMTMSWYPAYVFGVCLVFQLFLYSALGTIVETANDKLVEAFLHTNYHLLPMELQHDFGFMVRMMQNAQHLNTGFGRLDVTLFVQIMRKIYTFIVLLRTII